MSGFRKFLKSLGPGEAGFVNACIGLTAFSLGFYKYQQDIEQQHYREFEEDFDRTLDLVNTYRPSSILQKMKRYRHRLRLEAESIGVYGTDRDELSDEWLRRRNNGEREAEKINIQRLQMKSLLNSLMNFVKHYPEQSRSHIYDNKEKKENGNFHSGSCQVPVKELDIKKILIFLEPLDKACCRHHPACNWDNDQDPIYRFFRSFYNIDENWPPLRQNEDDFRPGAVPEDHPDFVRVSSVVPDSRLAKKMDQIDQHAKKSQTLIQNRT